MAVQKSKKSRSRRGMRRAHDALKGPTLSTDPVTGEIHIRHHVTKTGFYKGKNVLNFKPEIEEEEEAGEG